MAGRVLGSATTAQSSAGSWERATPDTHLRVWGGGEGKKVAEKVIFPLSNC